MTEATIEYREAMPGAEHADLVRRIWSLRGRATTRPTEPIVSDGCVEIVLNLADPFEQDLGNGLPLRRQPLAMVVGPTARPSIVRPTGEIDLIGIRLQPWAASTVLGASMTELRDQSLALADVAPRVLAELCEQLHDLPTQDGRFHHAARVLTHFEKRPIEQIARRAVEQVCGAHEPLTVRELGRRLGRSVRTIQRVFAEVVGLSPKTLLRITRVQRALLLAMSTQLRWSRIAARSGYYDQAHFVRDFHSLVGCTPSAFRPDQGSLTTSFLAGTHEAIEAAKEMLR